MKRSVEYISKFNFLLNEDAYFPNNLLTLILGGFKAFVFFPESQIIVDRFSYNTIETKFAICRKVISLKK